MTLPFETGRLDQSEKLDWLRLYRSENVGAVTFKELLKRYGKAGDALKALPEIAGRSGRRIALCSKAKAEKEWEKLEALGGQLIAQCEPEYPPNLCRIPDPPPLISLKGLPSLFSKPALAIVGARNASAIAQRFAEQLARDMSEAGWLVISGLARGVDAAAHRGALPKGTAGVIAGGLDIVYPPEHRRLQEELGERGALIAEQPVGMKPLARHFPKRNRIIAGLSLGVVVVEGHRRSGSLITARLANDYGRQIFAVPGFPTEPRAQGPNLLLRQGAVLVESANDILGELEPQLALPLREEECAYAGEDLSQDSEKDRENHKQRLRELLSAAPSALDDLLPLSELTVAEISAAVLEMELAGEVDRQPGNRIALLEPGR